MMNCLLCGVGGQGTVLASRVIAQTAMEAVSYTHLSSISRSWPARWWPRATER